MMKGSNMVAKVLQNVGKCSVKTAVNSASFFYLYQEKEPASLKTFFQKDKK